MTVCSEVMVYTALIGLVSMMHADANAMPANDTATTPAIQSHRTYLTNHMGSILNHITTEASGTETVLCSFLAGACLVHKTVCVCVCMCVCVCVCACVCVCVLCPQGLYQVVMWYNIDQG